MFGFHSIYCDGWVLTDKIYPDSSVASLLVLENVHLLNLLVPREIAYPFSIRSSKWIQYGLLRVRVTYEPGVIICCHNSSVGIRPSRMEIVMPPKYIILLFLVYLLAEPSITFFYNCT